MRLPPLPLRAAAAAALALALGSAAGLGLASWGDRGDGQAQLSLQDLRNFSEAFALIKRRYVDEVDDRTLLKNAIRGMVDGLDPYTAHLDREELKDWEATTSGEFGGLGIVVTKRKDDGPIRVIAPIDDTPAKRAGIRSGDRILELDGEPVHDLNLHEAVQIMRGKPGTRIVLTLERDGTEEPLEVTITRAVIKVASVRSRMLEPGYGYLRISNFQARTGADFRAQLRALEDEAGGALRGLVLDLRDNPGGLFSAAVEISDAFLERARRIVTTRGRTADSNAVEDARGGDLAAGVELVVLINQGSASASEIVAGALQRPRPRRAARHALVRQGLGADAAADRRPQRRAEADHRPLLHALRALDPRQGHRPGPRAGVPAAAGRRRGRAAAGPGRGQPGRLRQPGARRAGAAEDRRAAAGAAGGARAMSRALVPLADGCEELEAVTLIDLLRRAGVEVVAAGLAAGPVTAARGTRLLPDATLDAALADGDYDLVALPGGLPGADHLLADARLAALLPAQLGRGGKVAAICAAPKVLAAAGALDGRRATCYPAASRRRTTPRRCSPAPRWRRTARC